MSIFHSWKHTMPIPDVQLEALIALAAEKRVAGEKWQAVAEAVNRSVRTVQNWPKGHPEVWKKHFAKAEAHLMKDASSEEMHVLRKLMRSKREDVQQLAAQKILQLREARKKTARKQGADAAGSPIPEVRQLIGYLEGMTHEQFYDSCGIDPPALADGPPEPLGDDPECPALAE